MAMIPLRSPSTSPPSVNSVAQVNPGDRINSGKSEIAPIVAILSRQLPLPQAQQFAGQTTLVRVIKSEPGGKAELEVAGQKLAVQLPQGRTLTAGEMVTVSFALTDKGDGLGAPGVGAKKIQDTRNLIATLPASTEDAEPQQSSSFVDRLSGAARLIGLLERLGQGQPTSVSTQVMSSLKQLSTQFSSAITSAPLPTSQSPAEQSSNATAQARQNQQTSQVRQLQIPTGLTGALAQQVSAAVENSGLFYESHLQQWALGQRSTDQLAQEPQVKFGPEQVIGEKGLDASAVSQSAKLVNAQLATLDTSRIVLSLQGLLGQAIDVEIEPDSRKPEDDQTEPEGTRPWVAKLKLDMAHLGTLQVRLRMVGSVCDVQITGSADSKNAVDPHWKSFEQAMRQHGLQLNHGQFIIANGEPHV